MKSFKHHYFYYPFFMLLTVFFLFFSGMIVSAAVKTSDLETVPWSMVTESSIINEKGWLQSMCATDQYIVCLVNASKKGTDPDTLIAFYRNTTDTNGNPVEQYSYAFSVTETDYEHGNGMTYNPSTQEIAIAGLFTNDPAVVDAGMKRLTIMGFSYGFSFACKNSYTALFFSGTDRIPGKPCQKCVYVIFNINTHISGCQSYLTYVSRQIKKIFPIFRLLFLFFVDNFYHSHITPSGMRISHEKCRF